MAPRLQITGGDFHIMGMRRLRHGTLTTSAAALAAALFLGLAGCSSLRRPGPTIDTTQDPRIIQEVQARLAAEPVIDASHIRVDARGGVVMLYGSVAGLGQWQCAIRNAELVPGVATVVDYLVLERGPREVDCQAPRSAPE